MHTHMLPPLRRKVSFFTLALLCLAWTATMPGIVRAADRADITRTEWAVYLNDAGFKDADQRLNATYRKIMSGLDPREKQTLLKDQRAWIKTRNKDAHAHHAKGSPEYIRALADATARREAELRTGYPGAFGPSAPAADFSRSSAQPLTRRPALTPALPSGGSEKPVIQASSRTPLPETAALPAKNSRLPQAPAAGSPPIPTVRTEGKPAPEQTAGISTATPVTDRSTTRPGPDKAIPLPAPDKAATAPVPDKTRTAASPVPDNATGRSTPDRVAVTPVTDKPATRPAPGSIAGLPAPDKTAPPPPAPDSVAPQPGPANAAPRPGVPAAVRAVDPQAFALAPKPDEPAATPKTIPEKEPAAPVSPKTPSLADRRSLQINITPDRFAASYNPLAHSFKAAPFPAAPTGVTGGGKTRTEQYALADGITIQFKYTNGLFDKPEIITFLGYRFMTGTGQQRAEIAHALLALLKTLHQDSRKDERTRDAEITGFVGGLTGSFTADASRVWKYEGLVYVITYMKKDDLFAMTANADNGPARAATRNR